MEAERLSSKGTPIAKFVFPALFLVGFGAATVNLWFGSWAASPLVLRLSFPGVFVLALAFFAKYSFPLKKVILNGSELIVSNYVTTERVPLDNVSAVLEHPYVRGNPITVRFLSPNRYGVEILFVPRIRWFLFGSHPIASYLRNAVSNSRHEATGA